VVDDDPEIVSMLDPAGQRGYKVSPRVTATARSSRKTRAPDHVA
jgi:hypothetical protein